MVSHLALGSLINKEKEEWEIDYNTGRPPLSLSLLFREIERDERDGQCTYVRLST